MLQHRKLRSMIYARTYDNILKIAGVVVAVLALFVAIKQLNKSPLQIAISRKQATAADVLEKVKLIDLALQHIRYPGQRNPVDDLRFSRNTELQQLEPTLQTLLLLKEKVRAHLQDVHVLAGIDELRDIMRDLNRAQEALVEAETKSEISPDDHKIALGLYKAGDVFGGRIKAVVTAIEFRLESLIQLN